MKKQLFIYSCLCIGIYLSLCLVEFTLLRPLVDFIGSGFWIRFAAAAITLFLVDPLATRLLAELYRFRPDDDDGDI